MRLVLRNTGCQQHLLACRCLQSSRSYLALTFSLSVPVHVVHESQVTAGAGMGRGQGHSEVGGQGCGLSQLKCWPGRWRRSVTRDCGQGFPFPHPNWRNRFNLGGKQRISPPNSNSHRSPTRWAWCKLSQSKDVTAHGELNPTCLQGHGTGEMTVVSGWLPAPAHQPSLTPRPAILGTAQRI